MMSPVCCSRSLFLAVLCCFSAVFRALFSAVILALRLSKSQGFCGGERAHRCIFPALSARSANGGIVNDPSCRPVPACLPHLDSRNFNHLLLISFRLARARARALPRGSQQPPKAGIEGGRGRAGIRTPAFAGATRERQGNSFVKLV